MDGNTATIVQQVLDWFTNVGKFVVENGWRIAMRQVYFYGAMDIIAGVLVTALGSIGVTIGLKSAQKNGWKTPARYEDDDNFFAIMMTVIGSLIIIFGVVTLLSSVRFFYNPEWYAIDLIIKQVK